MDFGGDSATGPSSLWCIQELRDLEGLHEARRCARFLCQLAGADHRRPLGIFSNLPALQQDLQSGWPVFSQNKESLAHEGPLPKTCPCEFAHLPMVGVSTDQKFCSLDGLLLGLFFGEAVKSDATSVACNGQPERTSTASAFSPSSSFPVSFSRLPGHRCMAPGGLETFQRNTCQYFLLFGTST